MNEIFLIEDTRFLEHFKDKSFSGFKKSDVIKTLFKSIETGKVENACHWITECIVSGYCLEILDKLIAFSSKIVHINNPRLPQYLWRKYSYFYKTIDNINLKKDKHLIIHFRNNQVLRNLLFDIVTVITLSPKSKRYDKYPKIDENIDFQFDNIKKRLNAQCNYCPDILFKFTDPEELRVVINEIMFHFKNINSGYDNCCYWIAWIFQWEKKNKKMKHKFEIDERDIKDVKKNLRKDVVWLIWSSILVEANERDEIVKSQIQGLYQLFKYEFSGPKRNLKVPLIYHAMGYLTHTVKYDIPIIKDKKTHIRCQCNVNQMFKMKKTGESKQPQQPIPKKEKKKVTFEGEKIQDIFSVLNDIDSFIS